MHEFSLAEELLRSVERLAADHPGPVLEVELQIGALTAVNEEALQTAFGVLREGTRLARAVLVCQAIPVRLRCQGCHQDSEPADPLLLSCAACGSPRVELLSGRELAIVRIRLEEEPCMTS